MAINYERIKNIKFRDLEKTLFHDCFLQRDGKGSHRQYKSEDPTGQRPTRYVMLPYRRGRETFPRGTLRSIIERQAKWTEADLIRLKLIPA